LVVELHPQWTVKSEKAGSRDDSARAEIEVLIGDFEEWSGEFRVHWLFERE